MFASLSQTILSSQLYYLATIPQSGVTQGLRQLLQYPLPMAKYVVDSRPYGDIAVNPWRSCDIS